MKFCNIVPTKLIEKYSGDFVMALANYLDPEKENEYEKAILSAQKPIVLDNGAFETGSPDGIDNLLRKARRLKPAYIFAPDHLFNAEQTRKGYEIFKNIQEKAVTNFKIGVVVQADNLEEYLEEFKKYNEDPEVTVIGLSYLAISHSIKYKKKSDVPKATKTKTPKFDPFNGPDYTADRIEMLKKIAELGLEKIKPLHLLGLGKSYDDILFAKNYPYCRYNDTSTCYMAAKKGFVLNDTLEVPGGKIREKINIQDQPSGLVEQFLKNNINKVNSIVCKKTQEKLLNEVS